VEVPIGLWQCGGIDRLTQPVYTTLVQPRNLARPVSGGKERGGPGGPPLLEALGDRSAGYHWPPVGQPPLPAVVQVRAAAPPFVFVIVKTLVDLAVVAIV
jgi:hypothetical protein